MNKTGNRSTATPYIPGSLGRSRTNLSLNICEKLCIFQQAAFQGTICPVTLPGEAVEAASPCPPLEPPLYNLPSALLVLADIRLAPALAYLNKEVQNLQGGPSGWIAGLTFDFGCSALCLVLLGMMGSWQNWLGKMVEHKYHRLYRSKSTQPNYSTRWTTL